MKCRVTVNAVIKNDKGEVILCKMPEKRGVYPGQWALPGGGIDEDERMEEALHREIWEEVGLKIRNIEPIHFQDDLRNKFLKDGRSKEVYMIHLVFQCRALNTKVDINEEFEEYAWVKKTRLGGYDLNEATRKTFTKIGWL